MADPIYLQNLERFNIAATAEVKALYPHVYANDTGGSLLNASYKGLLQPFYCPPPSLSNGELKQLGCGCVSLWPLLAKSLRIYPKLVRAEQLVADAAVVHCVTQWWIEGDAAIKLEILDSYKAALADCRLLPKTAALISYLLDVARPTILAGSTPAPSAGPVSVFFTVLDSLGNPIEGCPVNFESSNVGVGTVATPDAASNSGVATAVVTKVAAGTTTITASVPGSASTASIPVVFT